MKRMMNVGAFGLGGALLFAVAACSSSNPSDQTGSPAPDGQGGAKHTPKLSVVRTPGSAQLAAVKRLSLGPKSGGTGMPGSIRAGGAPGTCGFTSGDATCDSCITSTCCTEGAACTADADCNALVTCFDGCRDEACFSTCQSAHAAGSAKLDTFMSCVDTSCSTDCGGPPDGPPPGPPGGGVCGGITSGDPTCDVCLDTTCCGDITACIDDVECRDFMSCLEGCTDTKCETACQVAHPAGATELSALSTCVTTSCAVLCGGPSPPPPPPSGSPASCGLASGLATCDACIDTACCAQSSACVGDADCTAFIGCLNGCGDEVCANACAAAHATGAAKLGDVVTCLESSCGPSCN